MKIEHFKLCLVNLKSVFKIVFRFKMVSVSLLCVNGSFNMLYLMVMLDSANLLEIPIWNNQL